VPRVRLLLILALFAVGVLLRLPLAGFGETVEESLDPIFSALAFRDQFQLLHPPFFHFGYGRGLSWVPLVLGSPDGLHEVAIRRGLVQALLGPLVFIAADLLLRQVPGRGPGRLLAPTLLGLLVTCNEDLLHTGISGHETYMSAEWIAVAMVAIACLPRAPRAAALVLGAAIGMALMNHPLAAPALVLTMAPRTWRGRSMAGGALLLVLLPQLLRASTLIHGALPPNLGVLPPLEDHGRLYEMLAILAPTQHLEVAVIVGGTPLAWWVLRRTGLARLAALGCGALTLSFVLVAVAGSHQGWYWRPLAPMGAVLGAVALTSLLDSRPKLAPLAALVLVGVTVGSVVRAGAAYEPFEDGLRDAGHVTHLGNYLSEHRDEAPWVVAALAIPSGAGRSQLRPLTLDRRLTQKDGNLFAEQGMSLKGPALIHLEVAPGGVEALAARLVGEDYELVASGRQYLILRFENAADALPLLRSLCEDKDNPPALHDVPRWWTTGEQESGEWLGCRPR